jgi:hypothetical protein
MATTLLSIFFILLLTVWAEVSENHRSVISGQSSSISGHTIEDTLPLLPELNVYYDPPNGTDCPTALGIYAWTHFPTALIYYDLTGASPTLNSTFVTQESPYFTVVTPFKGLRGRMIAMIAVYTDLQGVTYRSKLYKLHYNVESSSRPNSYAYLVPGVESGGYFVQIRLEEVAAARPQSSTTQEFADFFAELGIGTYSSQVSPLKLTDIDSELLGFEGGFPYNVSGKHYGLLIPFHNGKKFFGKVVRIDLKDGMQNVTKCAENFVIERYDAITGKIVYSGPGNPHSNSTCVHVLDLQSMYPQAVGFRRGFLSYPFGYLSPGQYSTAVRIDLTHFSLNHSHFIDLGTIDREFGGYSGGFADGNWACFSPYRTFVGRVGGIRSNLPVDGNSLTPYYNSVMVCVNESLWHMSPTESVASRMAALRTMDFSIIRPDFRGFADALRIGRHVYLCPLNIAETTYSPYLLRIDLGVEDIGAALDVASVTYGGIRTMVNTLNLSMVNTQLKGYSGLFTAGQYLFLVPYRNAYEPQNGQRGHGLAVRLNMNDFSPTGISILDMPSTTRNQIPSFPDTQLRGFSFGFASGLYAFMVPFFNADFHGKIGRFQLLSTLSTDVQELCLTFDRKRPNLYKGYRGGFASLWQGVEA